MSRRYDRPLGGGAARRREGTEGRARRTGQYAATPGSSIGGSASAGIRVNHHASPTPINTSAPVKANTAVQPPPADGAALHKIAGGCGEVGANRPVKASDHRRV